MPVVATESGMQRGINVINITEELLLDDSNNVIFYCGTELCISEKEKRLLVILVEKEGEPVSHDIITAAVWPERKNTITSNNILQLVFRLRRRLEVLEVPYIIMTVPRQGYRAGRATVTVVPETAPSLLSSWIPKSTVTGCTGKKAGFLMGIIFTVFIFTLAISWPSVEQDISGISIIRKKVMHYISVSAGGENQKNQNKIMHR